MQPDLKRLQALREELSTLVYIASVHTVATAVLPNLKEQAAFDKVCIEDRRTEARRGGIAHVWEEL